MLDGCAERQENCTDALHAQMPRGGTTGLNRAESWIRRSENGEWRMENGIISLSHAYLSSIQRSALDDRMKMLAAVNPTKCRNHTITSFHVPMAHHAQLPNGSSLLVSSNNPGSSNAGRSQILLRNSPKPTPTQSALELPLDSSVLSGLTIPCMYGSPSPSFHLVRNFCSEGGCGGAIVILSSKTLNGVSGLRS